MFNQLPKDAHIIEVGPRDGLQNEKTVLATEDKAKFIELLAQAGLSTIEITSFVRADKIPQMGDAKELFSQLNTNDWFKKLNSPCLVPNLKGLEIAKDLGVSEIAIFTATSNTFNQKNINATIEESFDRFKPVVDEATKSKMKLRGYVSTVFGCPYEGETSVKTLIESCHRLFDLGVYEISLGDTIGVANPLQVKNILTDLKKEFSLDRFAMHFHDTRGLATSNIVAALEMGSTRFDASAGGLGGCPYAKGSTGNVATEDVVYLLESMGINTGVDIAKLVKATTFISAKLGKASSSKFYKAYMASGK
jgi:hydroxymethylglutaryl-CoA lyase